MSDELLIRPGIAIPAAELSWRFSRSSGPGGQSVNTADSRVELRWNLRDSAALPEPLRLRALERLAGALIDGAIVITASEHRGQLQNRRAAQARLVAVLGLAIAAPPARRRPTKPSRAAVARRLDSKHRRATTKRNRRADSD